MSVILTRSAREIRSIFELIGYNENSITLAIAWMLTHSSDFRNRFLTHCGVDCLPDVDVALDIHRHEHKGGITDLEIVVAGHFHVLVEAKRGWILPGVDQLRKYAARQSFQEEALVRRIVSLSECSRDYAKAHLVKEVDGVTVTHIPWRQLVQDAEEPRRRSSHAERHLLAEFRAYMRIVMTERDQLSNLVLVVALNAGPIDGWKTTWIEVVTKYSRYFHPIGGKYPKIPPNYLGFRYGGRLRSIHYVEKYEVIKDLSVACPGEPAWAVEPYFLYTLGPAIMPSHEVVTGSIKRSNHAWCALDTLLTSNSISDARDLTKARCVDVSA